MKRLSILAACLATTSLVWTNLSGAGPLQGIESKQIELLGTRQNMTRELAPGERPGERRVKERFAGGERACVILRGDHDPVEDLTIEVFDDQQNLVTKDDGKGDYAVVVWYPPQDGEYTIVLKHSQADFNKCYLVIK